MIKKHKTVLFTLFLLLLVITGSKKTYATVNLGSTPSCGSASGQIYAIAPTTNLCDAGLPSKVSGSNPRTWTCSNFFGETVSCATTLPTTTTCITEEIAPSVCDITNPTDSFCFPPAIGTSTLLVKDGKVAINSNDVDRTVEGIPATTISCDTGYTYSGGIEKCVKTTCTGGGTTSKCDFLPSGYTTTPPENINPKTIVSYPSSRRLSYVGTAINKYVLDSQEKVDIVNEHYLIKDNLWAYGLDPLYSGNVALENKVAERVDYSTSTLPGVIVYNGDVLDLHTGNLSINTVVPWVIYWNALKNKITNDVSCPIDGSGMPNLDPAQEYLCYYEKNIAGSNGGTTYTYSNYSKQTDTVGQCIGNTIYDPYLNAPVDPHRTISLFNDIGTSMNPASVCGDFSCGATTCKVFYTNAINPCTTAPNGGTLTCNYTKTTYPASAPSVERGIVGQCKAPSVQTCTTETKDPIRTTIPTGPAVLFVDGTVRGTTLVNYSDISLKTNIQKIDNALENITKLNGYQFTWKDSGKPDFGVLAQEVEKVYASMVSTDSNGIKAVEYTALFAPIIEAIHEINNRIDELMTQAQKHQNQLTEQSNKLDLLENK